MQRRKLYVLLGASLGLVLLLQGGSGFCDTGKSNGATIDLEKLNQKYRNAVVRVEITSIRNFSETRLNPEQKEEYDGSAHGTGFFISEDEILTNAHVVGNAKKGSVRIQSPATGNAEFKMDLVGVGSPGTVDLAVIKFAKGELDRFRQLSGNVKIPTFTFTDSSRVKQSAPLAIFGYPLASDELKVIQAEVTGRQYHSRGISHFPIRHQFIEVGPGGTVHPGNSGGPAVNSKGRIVGIPTLGNWRSSQGWLIPSNIVSAFLDRIKETGEGDKEIAVPDTGLRIKKNTTGISVLAGSPTEMTQFELGVVVEEVMPTGQAKAFGLEKGDIIVGFANKQKGISCALDFEGYRVVVGKMAKWPEKKGVDNTKQPRLHLQELFFISDQDDDVTLWTIRPKEGEAVVSSENLTATTKKIKIEPEHELPLLSMYDLPDYARWGDMVVQELNSYNVRVYGLPDEELKPGRLIVTHVATGGIVAEKGLSTGGRYRRYNGRFFIVDAVNGQKVTTLDEFRNAVNNAASGFEALVAGEGLTHAQMILRKERYLRLTVRTETRDGMESDDVIIPIDEAQKSASNMTPTAPLPPPAGNATSDTPTVAQTEPPPAVPTATPMDSSAN